MRIPSLPDWVLHGSYPVPLAALVFLPRLFSRYAHSAWDSGEPWSCTAVHWLLFCFLCFLMVITDFHFLYDCFQLLRLCFPRVIITPSSFSWNVKTHEKLLLKKKSSTSENGFIWKYPHFFPSWKKPFLPLQRIKTWSIFLQRSCFCFCCVPSSMHLLGAAGILWSYSALEFSSAQPPFRYFNTPEVCNSRFFSLRY